MQLPEVRCHFENLGKYNVSILSRISTLCATLIFTTIFAVMCYLSTKEYPQLIGALITYENSYN